MLQTASVIAVGVQKAPRDRLALVSRVKWVRLSGWLSATVISGYFWLKAASLALGL
jgi:hypothetical protein